MASKTPSNPKIDSQTFVAVMWSGTVVSLSFVAFRIFVRIKSFRRIYADDVLVIIAWLMFLVSTSIWQSQQKAMYEQFILSTGTVIPTPEQLAAERKFLRSQVATVSIYVTSLWIVKLSFLVFFRRLGQNVRGQRIWWWFVTGFTVITWATCIGIMGFKCLLRSLDYIFAKCASPSAQKFQWATLDYTCAVDVITDVAIITIPVLMLWNVRISRKKKWALMSIFSLTVIVIIFSIVRVAVVSVKDSTADISWLYMWSNIEVVVSITVSCLASFRQLFIKSEQSGHIRKDSYLPLWAKNLLSTLRLSKDSSYNKTINRREVPSTHNSTERIVPLRAIHFGHQAGVPLNSGDYAV